MCNRIHSPHLSYDATKLKILLMSIRGLHGPGPGPRPVPGKLGMIFPTGRHMRGDFSNGPGRAGKKRNEFFNGRIWLQKKEDE